MAIAVISFGKIQYTRNGALPVFDIRASEMLTLDGTSKVTTGAALEGEVVRISTDLPVFITLGTGTPSATDGVGHLVHSKNPEDIFIRATQKVAVIDSALVE